MSIDLAVQAVTLTWNIVDAWQNAPRQRGRCKLIVEHIARLGKLLEEIRPSLPSPLTPQAQACFEELNDCLKKAYKLMDKTSKSSSLKYIFFSNQVADDLSSVSVDIEACLRSLPLIQFVQSSTLIEEVRLIRTSFSEVGKQLQEQSVSTREQHDLASEVLEILRSRKSAENQDGALDRLLTWLAERFESDMQTVREEWQEMKNNVNNLSEQAERSALSKSQVEGELLQQIILCIDELETGRFDAADHSAVPLELTCKICLGLMNSPVILSSGHSFCRPCIEENFRNKSSPVCPVTRQPVSLELIENFALRGTISRWKQTDEAPRDQVRVAERVYEAEFVRATVDELQSESAPRLLKSLDRLVEIGRSAGGAALVFQSGGITSLVKLLDSQNRKVSEKVVGILALVTSPSCYEDTGQQGLNDIFELCIDRLVDLMSRGNRTARLKAAETLTNLLHVAELIQCVLSQEGVVRSLGSLALEFDTGLEIGLRALAKLAGNRDVNLTGLESLVSSLIDLLKSEEDHIIEESVITLRSCMTVASEELPAVCTVLRMKRAVPDLVRCAAGGTAVQESAVIILELFTRHEGFGELVAAGFTRRVLQDRSSSPVILRLARGCLEAQPEWRSPELDELHGCIPWLMELLRVRECSVDGLALLRTLCMGDSTCKELVLDNGGLERLQELAGSSLSACRRGALSLLGFLLQGASSQEEFARLEGIESLCEVIEKDENVECISEAVRALGLLVANTKLRRRGLERLELDRVVTFLDVKYPGPCREAAGTIAVLLVTENESGRLKASRQSLKMLANVVQSRESSATVRRKSSKVLLLLETRSETRGLEDVKMSGLLADFIELSDGAGEAYKDLLQSFVSRLSNRGADLLQAGGVPLLLDAFVNVKYRSHAAASLRSLACTVASSHGTLLEAGFGRIALEVLNSESSVPCVTDVATALVAVFSGRRDDELFIELVKSLMRLLLLQTDGSELACSVVRSLSQLLPLDVESSGLVKRSPQVVKPLLLVLETQKREALELLDIADDDSVAKKEILKEAGVPKLIECLGAEDHRVQELASNILLTLGEPNQSISDNQLGEIRQSMVSHGIKEHLLRIIQETSEGSPVINCACLIVNLNCSGKNSSIADEQVFTVLLKMLRFYVNGGESHALKVRYLFRAVKTFQSDKRFKVILARNNMVGIILQTLEKDYGESDEVIKEFGLSLLTSLLEESSLSKDVSNMVLVNSVTALRAVIRNRSAGNKRLAVTVLKQVIKLGSDPQQACKVLRERECINPLLAVRRDVPSCSKEADEVLKLMKKHERTSKYFISEAERNFIPWGNEI